MRSSLLSKFRSFRKDEDGVTLVEYGIALILAVTVGAATIGGLGTQVGGKMDSACNAMNASITTC